MQTLQTGIYKNSNLKFQISNFQQVGFTLIELIVVIFIVSLTVALTMPSFWDTEGNLKKETKLMSSALRYIYDEAVSKKQIFLLNINFDDKSWGFKSEKESRSYVISEDVEVKDVIVPSLGRISAGEVSIRFGPLGPEESLIFHFRKGDSEYTVIFNHLNGRAKVIKGYI